MRNFHANLLACLAIFEIIGSIIGEAHTSNTKLQNKCANKCVNKHGDLSSFRCKHELLKCTINSRIHFFFSLSTCHVSVWACPVGNACPRCAGLLYTVKSTPLEFVYSRHETLRISLSNLFFYRVYDIKLSNNLHRK